MMDLTLLVSSAGRRVALIECFRRSAKANDINLKVLACDREPALSAACKAADRAFVVPGCTHPAFIETMLEIVSDFGVKLVVPTIDPELAPLAEAVPRFAELGARVHVSPPSVIEIVRDKLRTVEVLGRAGVPVPITVSLNAARNCSGPKLWPMLLKPVAGSASRGIRIIRSQSELPDEPEEPMVLQQLLKGPEFTVNMFVDQEGTLRSAIAHRRLRVRAGEVEKGRTEREPLFRMLAEQVCVALPEARGVMCFQLILDETAGPCVFEVNARFGGGYPLAQYAGADYAGWLLREVAGLPSIAHDNWRDGALTLRYDAAFFEG